MSVTGRMVRPSNLSLSSMRFVQPRDMRAGTVGRPVATAGSRWFTFV